MNFVLDRTTFDKAVEEMIRKHQIACDQLTEKQMADAIKQAILSGDFTKLCVSNSDSQAVIYMPYQGVEQLQSENRDLKEELALMRESGNIDQPC